MINAITIGTRKQAVSPFPCPLAFPSPVPHPTLATLFLPCKPAVRSFIVLHRDMLLCAL